MSTAVYKKKILPTCIAMALGSVVNAQEPVIAANQVEEVVVTGLRGSLERAMDIKRNAQGVVDSISSEDIGKFPDTNLAESLQRITGVSINRSNGEGQEITVRGLGPDFNLVTLNGRQMPVSGLEATSVNASRSFDFSNIASEGIAGVDVYKSSRADIPSGGIGATVNIKTSRPLDAPGLTFTLSGKAAYDTSRIDPEVTPEISGLYSQTFANDTVGVALSFSQQKRKGGYRQVSVPNGWHTQSAQQVDGWFAGVDLTTGDITEDDFIVRPQNIEYNFTEFDRDRTNGQLTLQFAPTDTLTATLDYSYSQQEIASNNNTLNIWFWEGEGLDEVNSEWALGSTNNAGGDVFYPRVFNHFGGDDLVFGVADFAQENENNSLGLNVSWNVNEGLTLALDYHDSEATSQAASPFGNSSVIQTAAFIRAGAVVDFSQDFAVMGARALDGSMLSPDQAGPGTLQPTGSSLRNSIFTNDIEQLQLRGSYKFDDVSLRSIDFGLAKTQNAIHRGMMVAQRDNWGASFGDPADLRDEVFTPRTVLGDFSAANGVGRLANGSGTFDQFDLYYDFSFVDNAADVVATQAPINSDNEVNPAIWPCPDRFCVTDAWATNQRTQETVTAAYVQANFEMDSRMGVWKATAGARYEQTDVESSAVVPAFTGIDWVADNEFHLIDSGDSSKTLYAADYNYFLPNLDISLETDNNWVFRSSYSKTISRANYNDISGGVTIGTLRNLNGDAMRGDPTLLPHESLNLDLSAEWYFAEASYVSFGAFSKRVENFVGVSSVTENLFGLRNPSQGPRFFAAMAALGTDATSTEIRDYIITNYPDSTTAPTDIHSLDEDPLYEFNVTIPVNEREADIRGLEFAFQYTHDTGFGGQFNYTMVDSDAEFDQSEFDNQFALVGLSDTMNLVAFYENDSVQARLAYNWRDSFLSNVNREHGNPEFVEAYHQWDLNMGYNLNDQVTFFAECLNITNETTRSYSRYEHALQSATELGARYNLGVRYTF